MKIASSSGVPVYTDYKENIIVEPEHSILAWKANKDRLRHSGLPKLCSVHSEDALTWNVFRTLQLKNRIQCLTNIFAPGIDPYQIWFWGHDASKQSEKIDREIRDILNQMEPWGKDGVKQQTESDVILRGKRQIVMVECKLGKTRQVGAQNFVPLRHGWSGCSNLPKTGVLVSLRGVRLWRTTKQSPRTHRCMGAVRLLRFARNDILRRSLFHQWRG